MVTVVIIQLFLVLGNCIWYTETDLENNIEETPWFKRNIAQKKTYHQSDKQTMCPFQDWAMPG